MYISNSYVYACNNLSMPTTCICVYIPTHGWEIGRAAVYSCWRMVGTCKQCLASMESGKDIVEGYVHV